MALETATYISDLVATNPTAADPTGQGQNHLRLLKSTLLATFPGITGALTATHTALNTAAGLLVANLFTIPISGGAGGKLKLKGVTVNTDVSMLNSGGTLQVLNNAGSAVAIVSQTGVINGSAILQGGNTLIPVGMIMMWYGSTGSIPAGWQLCDGTNGTPDLRNKFVLGAGSTYGVLSTGGALTGSGTTSAAGSHSHGGVTGAGGAHGTDAYMDTQGAHDHGAVTQGHVLTTAEMPSHTHTETIGLGLTGSDPVGSIVSSTGSPSGTNLPTSSAGGDQSHTHGITAAVGHVHNIVCGVTADHSHTIAAETTHTHTVTVTNSLPPYTALAYIMKI